MRKLALALTSILIVALLWWLIAQGRWVFVVFFMIPMLVISWFAMGLSKKGNADTEVPSKAE